MAHKWEETTSDITVTTPDNKIIGVWFKPFMAAQGHGYVNTIPLRWDDVSTTGRLNVHTMEAFVNTLYREYPALSL